MGQNELQEKKSFNSNYFSKDILYYIIGKKNILPVITICLLLS